jgi:hypothetical protein
VDGAFSSASNVVIVLESAGADPYTITIPITEQRYELMTVPSGAGDGFRYVDDSYGEFFVVP